MRERESEGEGGEREEERERERLLCLPYLTGLDVAKMLADRIQALSEEKFAELSVQLQSIPNADNLKKVRTTMYHLLN